MHGNAVSLQSVSQSFLLLTGQARRPRLLIETDRQNLSVCLSVSYLVCLSVETCLRWMPDVNSLFLCFLALRSCAVLASSLCTSQ